MLNYPKQLNGQLLTNSTSIKSKLLILSRKRSIISDKEGCLTENTSDAIDDSIDSRTSEVEIFINGQKLTMLTKLTM